MHNWIWFVLAALFEIGGCYAVWSWLRLDKSMLWLIPGAFSLILFALILTRVDAAFAGRTYAAYGGVYVVSSLAWMSVIERAKPLLTDYLGVSFCIIGAAVVIYGPKICGAWQPS